MRSSTIFYIIIDQRSFFRMCDKGVSTKSKAPSIFIVSAAANDKKIRCVLPVEGNSSKMWNVECGMWTSCIFYFY